MCNIDVLSANLDSLQTSIDKRHVIHKIYSDSDDDSITVGNDTTDADTTIDDEDSDSTDPVHPVPGLYVRLLTLATELCENNNDGF